jgi:hypothetical protein
VVSRPLLCLACLAALAGCADPPGTRKPLPLDYGEQTKAQQVYRALSPQLSKYDGVVGSYLTATNNPRRIVVVVKDKDTRDQMKQLFGRDRDGVKIRYEIASKGFEHDDGPIEAVPNQDLPVTWWDKVMFYMKHFAYRVMPEDMRPDGLDEPPTPPAEPADPNLKAT